MKHQPRRQGQPVVFLTNINHLRIAPPEISCFGIIETLIAVAGHKWKRAIGIDISGKTCIAASHFSGKHNPTDTAGQLPC